MMLWEELRESLIFLDTEEMPDRDGILNKMGNALVREGYVKDTYRKALIQREKQFPTGLDIYGIGVAIPHTDSCHVNKAGTALGILKNPVLFRHMEDESIIVKVRVIFMLAVLRPEPHLERLNSVLNIIQDVGVLERLLSADQRKDVIRIIKAKEETL